MNWCKSWNNDKQKIRHLMLRIHFYGSGNYAATGSRPWGRIFSGDIFNIIWR
ncbi:hypothetical protein [Spiroplasma endosymbiont of Glossina fuscipes fuscipes]|uniref:hypothetical protein n=1 Tax=Spiroplasma endosymbiont of Glossina fuscipes fuscipes TaxID=2004463 RepID=UPI003CEAEB56